MKIKFSRKFHFNQFMVTALSLMIAIAGYLTYLDYQKAPSKNETANMGNSEIEQSEKKAEEVYAGDSILEGTGDIVGEADDEPGDSLFVSSSDIVSFTAEAKLTREQTRAKSKEALLEVIENESLAEESKQEAANAMVTLSENMEKENAAETTLAAKGFENAIVTLQDGAADVVLNMEGVDDAGRAQIEEVIKTKTGVSVENITITPLNLSEE